MVRLVGFLVLLLVHVSVWAQTQIKWHGHAAFEVTTPKGAVLLVDPWLNNPKNPAAGENKDPVASIKKLDYIVITHGHFDHIGDAVALAKNTGARLVSNYELATNMAHVLGYPEEQMGFDTLLNIGGEIHIADGEVMVNLTPAVHSSGMKNPKAKEGQVQIVYGGNPTGVILKIKDGPTIYHTGDTAYFSDMTLIGEQYTPDLALINIGGHFGMEPPMAAKAAVAVKAKWVVPHHFATFPILTATADEFKNAIVAAKVKFHEMKPGDVVKFKGNVLSP